MFERKDRQAVDRFPAGSRGRAKAGLRLRIEPLEGRALLASLAPIPSVTVEAGAGYQVPLNGSYGGNTDPETYTVTTDGATGGVSASIASGEFLTIGVSHASSGANDPAFSGTMTFQLFQDLTPNSVSMIESLINATVPYSSLTTQAQEVIYPNGAGTTGVNYYTAKNGGDTFHRIANDFPETNDYIVQGGSINHDGTGQVFATPYANETSSQLVFNGSGQLALANSGGTDSNDSQFFVTTGSPRSLDGKYTLFGQLVAGQNILTDLSHVAVGGTSGTTPLGAVTITAATLSNTNPNGVVHINATNATASTQTNVTVTATDTVTGTQTFQTFPVLTIPSATGNEPKSTAPQLETVATPVNTAANTPVTFQLTANNPTGGQLTYNVQGGIANGQFTSVTNGTATVSSTGLVTVTPNAGYTGPIDLVVGVRDQTNRAGGTTLDVPANYSLQNVIVNVGTFPAAPTINPVPTPITSSVSQTVQFQLSATNPSGGQLSYVVVGGISDGAFTAVNSSQGTAGVTPSGLVSVIPAPGYTGPIDLTVGVRDQTNRAGTGKSIDDPTNFSTENIVINVGQPKSTGAVRFILDGTGVATGNLVVTPPPRPSKDAHNTIDVTQANGNVEVIVNGTVDLTQPAVSDVESIVVYGSKANDRISIDPSLTMPVELSGGTSGKNVLIAGGGPTREQGWYGTTVEKQGESHNYLFGRAGSVTFVKGSGSSDVIFAGTPFKPKGHSRIRRIAPPPQGTFFTFEGIKLVKSSDPFNTPPKSSAKKK